MKTLTIKQPWASLIAHGVKDVENRGWNTRFRGKFLVHAGKTVDTEAKLTKKQIDACIKAGLLKQAEDGSWDWLIDFPRGAILGEVTLNDVSPMKYEMSDEDSIWKEELSYGLMLSDAKLLDKPVPAKGKLGFWDYGDL